MRKTKPRREGEIKRMIRKVMEEDKKRDAEARRQLAIAKRKHRAVKAAQQPVNYFWLGGLLATSVLTCIIGFAKDQFLFAVYGGILSVVSLIVIAEIQRSWERLQPIRWGEFKLDEELETKKRR